MYLNKNIMQYNDRRTCNGYFQGRQFMVQRGFTYGHLWFIICCHKSLYILKPMTAGFRMTYLHG